MDKGHWTRRFVRQGSCQVSGALVGEFVLRFVEAIDDRFPAFAYHDKPTRNRSKEISVLIKPDGRGSEIEPGDCVLCDVKLLFVDLNFQLVAPFNTSFSSRQQRQATVGL